MALVELNAELVGGLWKTSAVRGSQVAADGVLVILESMKMEITGMALRAGMVDGDSREGGRGGKRGAAVGGLQ